MSHGQLTLDQIEQLAQANKGNLGKLKTLRMQVTMAAGNDTFPRKRIKSLSLRLNRMIRQCPTPSPQARADTQS